MNASFVTRSPIVDSPWDRPETVAGFTTTPPNQELLQFAREELHRVRWGRALDLGCGAGRNALPLARQGWQVLALDRSSPMLRESARRVHEEGLARRCQLSQAAMDHLPVSSRSCDFLVAHGIWNLATSGTEFTAALHEAARVAKPGAGLFVFTFSRTTLPDDARPIDGESFVFTDFSGQPQCFLTEQQLIEILAHVGFAPDPAVPLVELNRPTRGAFRVGRVPVIYQGAFRYFTPHLH
jgi:SAM-dependent methyltransferase